MLQLLNIGEAIPCVNIQCGINIIHQTVEEALSPKSVSHAERTKTLRRFPNLWSAWTEEVDDQLRIMFKRGCSVKEIAHHFQRSTGAIKARIEKLNLL